MFRLLPCVLTAVVLLSACGQPEEKQQASEPALPDAATTPYGTVAEVQAYLRAIGPHVQQIGQLQTEFETALASAREGSKDRRGTGRNLARKAEEVRPRLQALLEAFDQIEPPALLAPFHRDTRKLISLRLDAYARTIEGWEAEEAGGEHEPIYRQVEATLAEANRMIQSLNQQMTQIQAALQAATAES